jgi:hypothetical protein
MSVVKQAKKARQELNLPILSFEVADSWIDHLEYEQFGWWLKLHSWVDRSDSKYCDNHIPYTLESVFEKLGVSKATFYRKVKVLWECGLIEIVEFEKSERKSQKPKNILVYEYPFHEIERKYKPLTKLRDWQKDYESQSKLAGLKGGLMRKSTAKNDRFKTETVEKTVDKGEMDGLKTETVQEPVDNHRFKTETVDGLKTETVTVSEMKPINCTNKLLTNSNKPINNSNNSSLFSDSPLLELQVEAIDFVLGLKDYTQGEIREIIKGFKRRIQENHELNKVTAQDIEFQANQMEGKAIDYRPTYFLNGLEMNIGKAQKQKEVYTKKQDYNEHERKVPFYNWLEN